MALSPRTQQKAIGGAIGGAVGWVCIDWFVRLREMSGEASLITLLIEVAAVGLVWGIWIGLGISIAEDVSARAWRAALRNGIKGMLWGAMGGIIGAFIAQLLYGPSALLVTTTIGGLGYVIARCLGWGAFGAILGFGQGAVRHSQRGMLHGTLGGAIGGCIGGLIFNGLQAYAAGAIARLLSLIAIGSFIGLFIALVEGWLASATLKIVSGKLEGREFVLDKPLLTVGCNERCDIGIYYDRAIRAHHATLRWLGAAYAIEPHDDAMVWVNELPARGQPLRNNDIIRIGNTKLIYRTKLPEVVSKEQPSAAGQPAGLGNAARQPQPAATQVASAAEVIEQPKLCKACGHWNRSTARFCNYCGKAIV